jgi:hypothetical protein
MASRAPIPFRARPVPFAALLATIQTLPRPVLARLAARLIEQLDAIDGDPDAEVTSEDDEAEEDCCSTGDDDVRAGASPGWLGRGPAERFVTDDEDEDDGPAIWREHRDRIRNLRCRRYAVRGAWRWDLLPS